MMRLRIAVVALLLVLPCLAWTWAAPEGVAIVGDSHACGLGVATRGEFSARVRCRNGATVAEFRESMVPRGARFVVLSYGQNDATGTESWALFERRARRVDAVLRSRGQQAIWIVPSWTRDGERIRVVLERMHAFWWVPIEQLQVGSDGVHLTRDGYVFLLREVLLIIEGLR